MTNAECVLNAMTADWQTRDELKAKALAGLSGGKQAFNVSLLSVYRKGLIDAGNRSRETGEVVIVLPSKGRPPVKSERVYRLRSA